MFRTGRGMNYFLVSLFTCMFCGDLNSADKDYLVELNFNLLKGSQNLKRGRVLYIVIRITNTVV